MMAKGSQIINDAKTYPNTETTAATMPTRIAPQGWIMKFPMAPTATPPAKVEF